MKNSKLIAEQVSFMHPDKICDQISDLLLDKYLKQDPFSRVAIETVGGHGHIALFGEITSKGKVDHIAVVKKYYKRLTGQDIAVISHLAAQSREIAAGVGTGGAGDQGIMVGYACQDNEAFMPQEMYLAKKLLQGFNVDAKSQVTIENGAVVSVVLSVQGKTPQELKKHIKQCGLDLNEENTFLNNTGSFTTGGFDADSGCTGRKIVVDSYGPRVSIGGGAFSGKDPTKVDRSAAYMARFIALQLLKKTGGQEVSVKIAYAIGKAEPVMKFALVDGAEKNFDYDCRPQAIMERFGLRKPIYLDLAKNGHFGRGAILPWEKFE